MSYNIKRIETATYIEYYEYLTPIFTGQKTKSNTEKQNDINKKESNISERLRRMELTRKNSKATLTRIIDTNYDNKTSFLTLTTKQNIRDRKEFVKMFHDFINRFNYQVYNTKKRELKYIAILEKQKRGAFHAHVVLFNVPYIKHSKISNIWGNGFVFINKLDNLDDSSNAGRYISKYMEKGIGEELLESLGQKSYFASRNLKKPFEIKFYLEESIESLTHDSKVVYESEFKSKIFSNGKYYDQTVKYKKVKK